MSPDRIALLTLPGGFWGAEEAGIAVIEVAEAAAAETVRALVAAGQHAVVAVSAELASGREAELEAVEAAAPPEVAVFVEPAPGEAGVPSLGRLRERFAAALGVDAWGRAAARTGFDG